MKTFFAHSFTHVMVIVFFSLVFLFGSITPVRAEQCVLDQYSGNETYCSLSCGNNTATSGYEGCGWGQYCCAATGRQCQDSCLYGRKLYCSISGGGNPRAPQQFQDCGLGRDCYLGIEEASCPPEALPETPPFICGIHNDPETNTSTFCGDQAFCGHGSVESSSSVDASRCYTTNSCCSVSTDRCGSGTGCQEGRKEECRALDTQGFPVVGKSCPDLLSRCYLTDYDATCPPPTGNSVDYCHITPFEYNGRQLQTYCSVNCGGNQSVSFGGCGLGQTCCISGNDFALPPDGFFSRESEAGAFDLCRQSGNDPDCIACAASDGIWTGVGCIPYNDQAQTVRAFITLGLGIGGGSVVLMTLAGAFLISTSQGDPKRVEEGKSLITSAVAGILFIIFSVTIMRFIGVNILQLPAFG